MSRPHKRPVLFLAFANERDDRLRYLRNLPREASGLRDVLDRETTNDLWEVVERRNATLEEILNVFQDPRYRGRIVVFHFGGHADSDELMLESPEGRGVGADAGIFVTFLRQQHSLRLVFLNGCSTQGQVKELLAAGVPSVIATSRGIDDEVATGFAVRFYQGIAGGAGVRVAFEEAAASQQPSRKASLGGIYRKGVDVSDARWPWELHVRDGAESILDWNLGDSAGEPLLGLPPLPAMDLPPKPYRHLNWFGREHAHLFFGRGREIRELFERLTSSHTPPITLLYGQSGVGKSSLLAAGLLPRLAAVGTTRYVRRDRDTRLRSGLRQAVGADGTVSIREHWAQVERTDGRPLIILLDQIEEAFTRPHRDDPTEIDDFLTELCGLFLDGDRRPAGKLLLGFRKEWLADIEDRLVRLMLPHGKVFLDHLDAAGIAQAVAGPASTDGLRSHYRLTIADGLPERIAGDLLEDRGSPIAPALQLLLSKLWDRAVARSPEAPRFDGDLYTLLKREGVLLEDFVEQQLAVLREWQPELARTGLFLDFLAHHSTSIGSSRPRSWSDLQASYGHHLALLPELVSRARELSLLVDAVGIDDDSTTEGMTRLVHDAVARLVRRRFEQSDLPGQQARRLLERQTRAWANGGTGDALDDDELSAIESGLAGMRSWTPDEERLVAASRAERDVRRDQLRATAVIRALSTAREAKDDPLVAALLLAELADLPEPNDDIRLAIRVAERPFPTSVLEGHDLTINCVTFSPDGMLVATGSADHTARIWTLDGSGACTVLSDHGDEVTSVAFSPDGQLLATGSIDGMALLHRVDQSSPAQLLFGHVGLVLSCVFSRDGRFVATTSTDGTVRLWSLDGSAEPRILAGHDRGVRSAVFNAAGDVLLTLDEAGQARLWPLRDGAPPISLPNDKPITAAVFGADGSVVSASADAEVRVWPGPLSTPLTAHVLGDGALWNVGRGSARPLLCAAQSEPCVAHSLATDSIIVRELPKPDASAEWWWAQRDPVGIGKREQVVMQVPGVTILAVDFDSRGTSLLTRCSDGDARLWLARVSSPAEVRLTHGGPRISASGFSPNGDQVATADIDGKVRLWRVGSPAQPRSIDVGGRTVTHLAWVDDAILADTEEESVRVALEGDVEPTVIRRRVTEVRVSPDRTRLVARVGRQLAVLSTVPATAPLIIANDFSTIRRHEFTPDGWRLLVHMTDGALHVWNVVTGEHEWKRRGVQSATLTGDGKFVTAVGVDGVARVLEIESGDPVAPPNGGNPRDEKVDVDRAVQWTAADGSWIARMPEDGGEVTCWSIEHPDDRHLLTAEADWVEYVEERKLMFVRLRNRDLRVWSTDRWKTDSPGDGTLIDTDVVHLDIAPNRARGVIHTAGGMLELLDAELTGVERALFPVVRWAWNPDASWLATWSDSLDGVTHSGANAPPDWSSHVKTENRTWLLRVVKVQPAARSIRLAYIDVTESDCPRWAGNSHLLATVTSPADPDATPRLGIWDIRAIHARAGHSTDTRGEPIVVNGLLTHVTAAYFSQDNDYWAFYDDLDPVWRVEALSYDSAKRLTTRRAIDAPSLRAPLGAQFRCAFIRNRLAVARSVDGRYWVAVEQLDVPNAERVVASGQGSVERIEFAPDGESVDLTLGEGNVVRVPVEGRFTLAWQDAPDRIVHGFTAGDQAMVAMLLGDGTARVWKADGNGRPLRLGVPGRQIRLRLPSADAEPEPDIVVGSRGSPWITATLDDGTQAVWLDDGSGTARPLAVPGRRVLEVATVEGLFDRAQPRMLDTWIAVRLDDDTVRVWIAADPSSPITVAEHSHRIDHLRIRYADNALVAVLDDRSERNWVVEGNRVVRVAAIDYSASAGRDIISPDRQHVIRSSPDGLLLVRCGGDPVPPVPLTADLENRDHFQFSADGGWIVAEVADIDDWKPWALRVWNVNAPESSRLIPNVELLRVQGNFLHLQGRDSRMIDIVPFSGTDEPLTVPRNAVVVGDDRVMYIGQHVQESGAHVPEIHIRRVDRSGEPLVLIPTRARVQQAQISDRHVVARLSNGEICVWDLEWSAVAARVRACTTATLEPELRRRLLGEPV